MSTFGCIIPGQLPITNFEVVGDMKWSAAITVSNNNVNMPINPSTLMTNNLPLPSSALPSEIIVFLTGLEPLPPSTALAVYLISSSNEINSVNTSQPQISGLLQQGYMYIGCITNEYPSAVFKTPACLLETNTTSISRVLNNNLINANNRNEARIGLAVEPLHVVQNLGITTTQPVQQYQIATINKMASRIVKDFYIYITSFAKLIPKSVLSSSSNPSLGNNFMNNNNFTQGEGNEQGEAIVLPSDYVDKWFNRVSARIAKDSNYFTSNE